MWLLLLSCAQVEGLRARLQDLLERTDAIDALAVADDAATREELRGAASPTPAVHCCPVSFYSPPSSHLMIIISVVVIAHLHHAQSSNCHQLSRHSHATIAAEADAVGALAVKLDRFILINYEARHLSLITRTGPYLLLLSPVWSL
jgi:hypothetical protein